MSAPNDEAPTDRPDLRHAGSAHSIEDWLEGFGAQQPVVAVPVFDAYEDVVECIASVLDTTPRDTPVLVIDDGSTDERLAAHLASLDHDPRLKVHRQDENTGFVAAANVAFELCGARDVVLVNSDVVVPAGWLERLRGAAYSFPTVATATPLTNNGTSVSVPHRNRPSGTLIGGRNVTEVDERIRLRSLRLRPVIPTAIGHCTYYRRIALDAVGLFDPAFSPGYGEEVDFSQRAAAAGFSHVVADDLFVYHKGSRSFDGRGGTHGGSRLRRIGRLAPRWVGRVTGGVPHSTAKVPVERRRLQDDHLGLILRRYPGYMRWVRDVESSQDGPLALALERASQALLGYRVAVDGTRLDGGTTGTQLLTLELARALAESRERFAHLTLVVNNRLPPGALHGVERYVDEVVRLADLRERPQPQFDLMHRPYQVFKGAELDLLFHTARRCVVSQLDCIAYSSPSYARRPDEWPDERRLTQLVLSGADGIVFISGAGRREAAQEGLHVPDERARVIAVGTDHRLHASVDRAAGHGPTVPSIHPGLEVVPRPFLLMLGTDFVHKHRVFALDVLGALIDVHAFEGHLVFAGPPVASGGSRREEIAHLDANPRLRSRVHYLGPVDEATKSWLLANAALVLYPSTREGFGLVPFEAAALGTPALTTRYAALDEVLPIDIVHLPDLNVARGAALAWRLLSDPELAKRQVDSIAGRGRQYSWTAVAADTWAFYRDVLDQPRRAPELRALRGQVGRKEPSDASWIGVKLLAGWPHRVDRARHIWRQRGLDGLLQETRDFVRWVRWHP